MRLLHIAAAVIILLALVITGFALMSIDTQRRAAELRMLVIQGTMTAEAVNANATTAADTVTTAPRAPTLATQATQQRATENTMTTTAQSPTRSNTDGTATAFYALPLEEQQATRTAVYVTLQAMAEGG